MTFNVEEIEGAISSFGAGEMLIVTDDENRENEADLILLGSAANAQNIGFMVRYTSGVICAAMTNSVAQRLELPLMVRRNQDSKQTAYTVSVDAARNTTTGISATERALTLNLLSNSNSVASDFHRPGHIFPLVAVDGGLRERFGHTEAAVTLAQISNGEQVGVIAELVNDNGEMMRGEQLEEFALRHNLKTLHIADLIKYINEKDLHLSDTLSGKEYKWAKLPLKSGEWKIAIQIGRSGAEHAILKFGDENRHDKPMVRIHSECLTGDAFGSLRCDCGPQLKNAQELIAESGYGYIVYLHDHEGRGIGLSEKIKAYKLQDSGMDTVDANIAIGHQVDERNWSDATEIIKNLNLNSVKLISNNPDKVSMLEEAGIKCEQIKSETNVNKFNKKYLETKRDRLSHSLDIS